MASEPTIPLNAKTIGLFMAIIGALTFGWKTVSYFKDLEQTNIVQDIRLDRTDEDRQATKDLTVKTGELKDAVVRLTTVIETNGLTKKAEGPKPHDDVSVLPADYVIRGVTK